MNNYPKINDPKFSDKLKKKFSKFKIPKNKKSMKDICFPKKYTLQLPQRFVAEFINPNTPYKGLLLFHKIGAGKTCAAINIAEKWKDIRNILIISPASLMGNFAKELRTKCANDEYITDKEREILDNTDPSTEKYKKILKKSNDKINKKYTILSYHKYVAAVKKKKINLKNTLLIIDEVQNIVSEKGTFYKTLLSSIDKAPDDLRIVLLSATPIFDKPIEIALTMNLLKLPVPIPIGNEFNKKFLKFKYLKSNEKKYEVKNLRSFRKLVKGHVSYFRGAPPFTFPRKELKYVKCKMSDYQFKSYKTVYTQEGPFRTGDILSLPNNFFMGTRMLSNIAFPKKEINEGGLSIFKGKFLKMKNLKTYSIKFYKILKSIKKAEGPVFVYSNFKEYGGLKTFAKVLENNGFKNYKKHGKGKKRFAIWSGDQPHHIKEQIKDVFNKKKNKYGDQLKVLLGSPSIKEGVSLLRVREVHVIEPYWNMSRLDQIIGRAIRYCSHKDMLRRERVVKVFIYIATHPEIKMTVDKYILKLAEKKQYLINQFEKALKESAVDCKLNLNANVYKNEEKINCI